MEWKKECNMQLIWLSGFRCTQSIFFILFHFSSLTNKFSKHFINKDKMLENYIRKHHKAEQNRER